MLYLREVDKTNWLSVIRLSSAENQQNRIFEKTIASNCLSLVQANMEEGWTAQALYEEETLIGFAMFGYSTELTGLEVCRLKIDYRFQGRGFGRKALDLLVETMRRQHPGQSIFICVQEDNIPAKKLYESFGFINSNRTIEGNVEELVYELPPETESGSRAGGDIGNSKIQT